MRVCLPAAQSRLWAELGQWFSTGAWIELLYILHPPPLFSSLHASRQHRQPHAVKVSARHPSATHNSTWSFSLQFTHWNRLARRSSSLTFFSPLQHAPASLFEHHEQQQHTQSTPKITRPHIARHGLAAVVEPHRNTDRSNL